MNINDILDSLIQAGGANTDSIRLLRQRGITLTARITALEDQLQRLEMTWPVVLPPKPAPPEAQPWDGGTQPNTYKQQGGMARPHDVDRLIGIDEAGAVMDEDAEALSRLADESNQVQNET